MGLAREVEALVVLEREVEALVVLERVAEAWVSLFWHVEFFPSGQRFFYSSQR